MYKLLSITLRYHLDFSSSLYGFKQTCFQTIFASIFDVVRIFISAWQQQGENKRLFPPLDLIVPAVRSVTTSHFPNLGLARLPDRPTP